VNARIDHDHISIVSCQFILLAHYHRLSDKSLRYVNTYRLVRRDVAYGRERSKQLKLASFPAGALKPLHGVEPAKGRLAHTQAGCARADRAPAHGIFEGVGLLPTGTSHPMTGDGVSSCRGTYHAMR
jgi:hypothetical protein